MNDLDRLGYTQMYDTLVPLVHTMPYRHKSKSNVVPLMANTNKEKRFRHHWIGVFKELAFKQTTAIFWLSHSQMSMLSIKEKVHFLFVTKHEKNTKFIPKQKTKFILMTNVVILINVYQQWGSTFLLWYHCNFVLFSRYVKLLSNPCTVEHRRVTGV